MFLLNIYLLKASLFMGAKAETEEELEAIGKKKENNLFSIKTQEVEENTLPERVFVCIGTHKKTRYVYFIVKR